MTSEFSSPAPARPRDERWLWLLFAGAWLIHCYYSSLGWNNTLLNRFQFRQVQTAMAALFFPAHGFSLDYQLPLFGTPWAAPIEFPLYQASVAWFSSLTGMSLDPAGRLVSWLYFQLSLPGLFLLLGSIGLRRALRFITLALLVTSPIYLFYSRTFLMESTALCGGIWFLAAAARWLETGRIPWLVIGAVAGSAAALVKPPTMMVFSVGTGLLAVALWWRETGGSPDRRRPAAVRLIVRLAAIFAVPALLGLIWQSHTAAVRAHNPETAFLDVMFGFFSFGDLAQRLSFAFWQRTIGIWAGGVLSEAGLVLGLFLFTRSSSPVRLRALGAFATFLSGQLIFSNLYFVHDYYFYANGVFLIVALGILFAALFDDPATSYWMRWVPLVAVILLQLAAYGRLYLPDQQANTAIPELTQVVRDLTDPEDMILILGQDWDANIPYYAQRRALMFIAGRERDPAAIARSVDRLDPNRIGAVLLFGHLRNDSTFVAQTMPKLQLGPNPVLLGDKIQVGVWIPQRRVAAVRDRLPSHAFATLDVIPSRPPAGTYFSQGAKEISQQSAFAIFPVRPIRADSFTGFSTTDIGPVRVINAHAKSELVFHATPGLRKIAIRFGIHDGAYTNPAGRTDGVEFAVVHLAPDGKERVLFSRLLDPATNAADQGIQQAEVALDAPLPPGELVFRTLPGPHNNGSYDWSYWAGIDLQ